MLLRIGYEMSFELTAPTPMILMLYVHPERAGDLRAPETMNIEPHVPVEDFIDCFGNRCARLHAPAGTLKIRSDSVIHDSGEPEPTDETAQQIPVQMLPPQTLQFLMASRYCEVDRFSDMAWKLFGGVTPGWARVKAVCDWVHHNIKFGYQFARSTKTAWDVCSERNGVCRDYMHLAVTLCRCLGIPARYATGYLADIGMPHNPEPMDFSAYFEVFLGGKWWPFDARHNEPRAGRILMARGRDAVDVALTTSFGSSRLANFQVWTDEVAQD
jgi:transglutaminase-like putative cysteine protease